MNPYLKEILDKRGVEDVDEFLSPSPQLTYDPFLMKNMSEGVDLVMEHIDEGGTICIYGDYDADGVTSTAIIAHALKAAEANFFVYIPKRQEGYGLNKDAIDKIADKGATLIVTVDCGSSNLEEVAYAEGKGMDVLVTDHHTVPGAAPGSRYINPKYEDSGYPYKELAGCGVAFKFVSALADTMGLERDVKRDVLDLAAIGTIGDIVPLWDENRTIVKYGLKAIKGTKRKGLRALADIMGIDIKTVTEEEVSYHIVPRLNAAGRIDDPIVAYELLTAEDDNEAKALARKLDELNIRRKELQKEAADNIDDRDIDSKFMVTVTDKKYEGVIGIVAGTLKDRYNVPVIVLTDNGESLKGSARGLSGMNLYNVIATQKEKLVTFGGHAKACGLEVTRDRVDELREGLRDEMSRLLEKDPCLYAESRDHDIEPYLKEIDHAMYEELRRMAPFGAHNNEPVLLVNGRVDEYVHIGENGKHIKVQISDGAGHTLKALKWNVTDEMEKVLSSSGEVSVLGVLKEDNFRGRNGVQLDVIDIFKR